MSVFIILKLSTQYVTDAIFKSYQEMYHITGSELSKSQQKIEPWLSYN